MDLSSRLALLEKLKTYILSDDENWINAQENAFNANAWFIPEFIKLSAKNIADNFLQKEQLSLWATDHQIPENIIQPKKVGIVMAGNIPMVGFHDLLAVFVSGHNAIVKLSSRDTVLIKHLVEKMQEWNSAVKTYIEFATTLKGCDAYIATGSQNSSRYFEYYFQKYPHIIRRNRTSVAVLTGEETMVDLEKLADDIHLYFGLGCRNVTKIYVPENYDFNKLLKALKKFDYFMDHFKYKNNFDYMFSIHLLNQTKYMTNGNVLLVEEPAFFSPISQLNYAFYSKAHEVKEQLKTETQLQCIVGIGELPFGQAQSPALTNYADGINTLAFLQSI
ncbi:MAG: acyl-CoA reductase [Chitinophagaceae bacterium]|jgi:hypothetical protein|nr:acyl-CoA reductase [Chitinophagaceae bacterium]